MGRSENWLTRVKKLAAGWYGRILLSLFALTMLAYVIVFATAFADLPLDIGPTHQFFLLFSHCVPMFFLEIILCETARPLWRVLVPLILIAIPVLIFVTVGEFYVLAWMLSGIWCIAPVVGALCGRLVWSIKQHLT